LIPATVPEVRARLLWVVWGRPAPAERALAWSDWRRAHQQNAKECHYKKRGAKPQQPISGTVVLATGSEGAGNEANAQLFGHGGQVGRLEHRQMVSGNLDDLDPAIGEAPPAIHWVVIGISAQFGLRGSTEQRDPARVAPEALKIGLIRVPRHVTRIARAG